MVKIGFTPENFTSIIAYNKWFNKLFKLNPAIEKKFNAYLKRAKPTPSTNLICAQIRIGDSPLLGASYNHIIIPYNLSVFFWKFIKQNYIKHSKDYRIFITTDTESVMKEAYQHFEDNRIVFIDGKPRHVDFEPNTMNNCSSIEKVVMDFYMLGHCDMGIVSRSGFGMYGVARNRIPDNNFSVIINNSSDPMKPIIKPIPIYLNDTNLFN